MNKSRPVILAIGLAWIFFVPVRLMIPEIVKLDQNVKKATALTEGKVIAFDPSNHATGTFEYWVNGARYESSESGMSAFAVGSTVPVHYDPQNPSMGFAGSLPPSLNHNLFGLVFLVTIMLAAVLAGTFSSRRAWSKS